MAATAGSLAAAAQHLGVTQPTVSEQLRALERTLGASLFTRSPTGLKLTDAGRLAFEQTSVMFRAGDRLVEALGHRPVPSMLRVGVSTGIARSITTDFLMPLLAIVSCVPALETSDAVDLIRRLRTSELDLALTESEPSQTQAAGLKVELIDRVTLLAVAPPAVVPDSTWENVRLVQYLATSA